LGVYYNPSLIGPLPLYIRRIPPPFKDHKLLILLVYRLNYIGRYGVFEAAGNGKLRKSGIRPADGVKPSFLIRFVVIVSIGPGVKKGAKFHRS
jgi:hypothetical protein